ncbi:STM4014 family protein [Paenibacillus sp. AK121]|uniref:STM4014 family protein n=1 Tax=Paenibacillus TaxID=44249 RepID=UPI001C21FE76|nr:STM4014 family protein [Paenibacillus sp. AK121]MBU9706628.1 STM4014 family protein [Paenibacillus sp. AK121]MEE4566905.1 STM4014 family protein [Paenibacillus polymyxa]
MMKMWDSNVNEPFILFGNSGNRRTTGLQKARSRLMLPPALEVSYTDVLGAIREKHSLSELMVRIAAQAAQDSVNGSVHVQESIDQLLAGRVDSGPLLRLDAPGENFEVERELIALGAPDAEGDDSLLPWPEWAHGTGILAAEARRLQEQHGRIWHPAQWFRGYCRLLAWLRHEVDRLWPSSRWMNDPAEVAVMFDKRRCSAVLDQADIRVPPVLTASGGAFRDAVDLHTAMKKSGFHRVFVKIFCGSGASGVMAYQVHPQTHAELAVTTIGTEIIHGQRVYYNAGRLRRYTDKQDIHAILNWLCLEGVHVERWIPKATLNGRVYDVRQLVCESEACHAVLRLSHSPITNLHLRNERLSLEEAGLPQNTVESVQHTAKAAMRVFPSSMVAGLDVLVPAHGGRPYVLDVNPFGDLLYRVEYQGWNPYEWEMLHLANRSVVLERKDR